MSLKKFSQEIDSESAIFEAAFGWMVFSRLKILHGRELLTSPMG